MARHTPDDDLLKGKALLEKSEGKDWVLVRYFVSTKDIEITRLTRLVNEMREVFKGIKQFID